MSVQRWGMRSLALVTVLATCGMALGQNGTSKGGDMGGMKGMAPGPKAEDLPLAPSQNSGSSVTGAFEGWFQNPDGSYSMLVGYYNRNLKEAVDIPIGPDNDIEPGGPDQGQPTHFLPGRAWGMFTVKVPKDFGTNKVLTWTITANGVKTQIPIDIKTLWVIDPFVEAQGDTPAYIGFSPDGPFVNGPLGQTESISTTVGTPLPLQVWVADDAKTALEAPRLPAARKVQPVTVLWSMFRGPALVKFDNEKPEVEKIDLKAPPSGTVFDGTTTTTVTFSQPGEYELNMQALDSTGLGGRGFQCCWSNAKVKVSVK